jgi:hypothetical protein
MDLDFCEQVLSYLGVVFPLVHWVSLDEHPGSAETLSSLLNSSFYSSGCGLTSCSSCNPKDTIKYVHGISISFKEKRTSILMNP